MPTLDELEELRPHLDGETFARVAELAASVSPDADWFEMIRTRFGEGVLGDYAVAILEGDNAAR